MPIATPHHPPRRLFSQDGLDAFGLLLKPSWLSGLLAVLVGLALVAGTVFLLHYHGSSWQLLAAGQRQPNMVSENDNGFEATVSQNALFSDLPLLLFWAGVGLIVYFFVTALITALRQVLDLREQASYVHADRQQLVIQAVSHLLARAACLGVWIVFIHFTLHTLVPYVIALSYAGSGGLGWLTSTAYLIGAVGLAALSLHLHTVLLRLLLLRPRLFGQAI